MGPEGIVLHSPAFDEYLSLPEGVKDLSIQQFVPEFPVEAFTVAVFPGAPRLDGEAAELVEKVLDLIKESFIYGEDVMISGSGKWKVNSNDPRSGRNPQTGEEIILESRKVITCKDAPVLKNTVSRVLLNHGSQYDHIQGPCTLPSPLPSYL